MSPSATASVGTPTPTSEPAGSATPPYNLKRVGDNALHLPDRLLPQISSSGFPDFFFPADKSGRAGPGPVLMSGGMKIPPEILVYNGNAASFLRRRFQSTNDDL